MKWCPKCGVFYSDGVRHKRGYRIKDKKGNIIKVSRCVRQHIRKLTKSNKNGISSGSGKPYSQGY